MSAEPGFVAATLEWCNEMRAAEGMEPLDVLPKGKRKDPLSCPCGRAIDLHVERDTAFAPVEEWFDKPICQLPDPVREFVVAFDRGELPQYDEDAA